MSVLLAILVVVAFAVAIERLGFRERAGEVGARARRCLEVVRDGSLEDDVKARELRGQSLRLFGLFGLFVLGGALAILLPLAGVWALDRAGVASLADVLAILERPAFLVATIAVGLPLYLLARRLGRG